MKITKNSQKSELKKGAKLLCTSVYRISATKTETKKMEYEVTGHRNCKSGLRIRLVDEYGSGCTDVNFEWEPDIMSSLVSQTWETIEPKSKFSGFASIASETIETEPKKSDVSETIKTSLKIHDLARYVASLKDADISDMGAAEIYEIHAHAIEIAKFGESKFGLEAWAQARAKAN